MKQLVAGMIVLTFASPVFAAEDTQRDEAMVSQQGGDPNLSAMNRALTEARAIPNFENGEPAGHRVVPGKGEGAYENLELKNGDVLTAPDPEYAPRPESARVPQL
jgi:hypothetical protein